MHMQVAVVRAGELEFNTVLHPPPGRHPAIAWIDGPSRALGEITAPTGQRYALFVPPTGTPNCIVEALGDEGLVRGLLVIAPLADDGTFRTLSWHEQSSFQLSGPPGTTWDDVPVLRLVEPGRI